MPIRKPPPQTPPPAEGGLGGKIKNSFVRWFAEVSEGFFEFATFILGRGAEVILDVMGQAFAPVLRPILQTAIDSGRVPPELLPLLEEMMDPSGEIAAILGGASGGAAAGGLISSTAGPFLLLLQYEIQRKANQARLDPSSAINLIFRQPGELGLAEGDLRDMGWDDRHIDAFKTLAELLPSGSDIVRFANREAYDDGYASRWGSDQEFPTAATPDLEKIGMKPETFAKQWRAHWGIPSVGQGFTMLHRLRPGTGGPEFGPEQLRDLLFAQDVMPGWRKFIEAISFSPFTRVDARRMWDVGALSDDELLAAYQDVGFDLDKAAKMVLFTKLFERMPELRARFRNGWISSDEFLAELIGFGVAPDRAQTILETATKAESPARTQKERDLTKADILKGVKRETLTDAEGVEMLVSIGFSAPEAEYLIIINAPVDKRVTAEKDRVVSKADVLTGLKEGVLTRDQAFDRLLRLRYIPVDAELILSIFEARVIGPAPAEQRQLTKADIVKGVATELLTRGEGFASLIAVGYTEEQSDFILTINIEEEAASPISFQEFKKIVDAQRRADGETTTPVSQAVILAEQAVNRLKAQLAAMRRQLRSEDDMAPVIGDLGVAEVELLAALTGTEPEAEEAPAPGV